MTQAKSTPTVTVTPSCFQHHHGPGSDSHGDGERRSGNPTPTGSVTLTGGGYTSAATTLSGGSATINIPADSLSYGTDTLDGQLHAGLQQLLDLQQCLRINHGHGDHSSQDHAHGDGDAVRVEHHHGPGLSVVTVTVARDSDTHRLGDAERRRLHFGGDNSERRQRHHQHPGRIAEHGQRHSHRQLHAGLQQLLDLQQRLRISHGDGDHPAKTTPTVTVTPSASSITTAQASDGDGVVSGGTGNPTPTGSVTLSGGGYTSAATTLSSGSATINIPAGLAGHGQRQPDGQLHARHRQFFDLQQRLRISPR